MCNYQPWKHCSTELRKEDTPGGIFLIWYVSDLLFEVVSFFVMQLKSEHNYAKKSTANQQGSKYLFLGPKIKRKGKKRKKKDQLLMRRRENNGEKVKTRRQNIEVPF